MAEDKIMNLLEDFAFKLQNLSARPIENMEVILPYENWRDLQFEMEHDKYNLRYGVPYEILNVQTHSGIKFAISCKELNDAVIKNKLNDCFKILTDVGKR